jgi:hypothetical protein
MMMRSRFRSSATLISGSPLRIGFRKIQPSRSAMFNSRRSFSSSRLTAATLRCFFAFVFVASLSARKARISLWVMPRSWRLPKCSLRVFTAAIEARDS